MTEYRFGDICKVINGRAYRQPELLDSGKYPVLRVGNFFSSDRWFYSDLELPEDKYCDNDDLLFAWSASFGPRIWDGGKVIYHYHIWKLEPNEAIADKYYLYYWLRKSVDVLTAGTHGSVMAHMTKGDMENQRILLPDIEVQRQVGKMLRLLDDKIKINSKINDNLEQQATAIFGALANACNSKKPLGDFIKIKHGYAFKGDYISTEDNGIVLVTPGNFRIGGGFKENKCKYFTGDYPKDYVLEPDSLIVTMTDLSKEADTLGFSALVPRSSERVYLHNQRIGLVEPLNNEFPLSFIYWYMRSYEYHMNIVGSASGSTVKHTSPGRILEQLIPIPDKQDLMKYGAVLDEIDDIVSRNNAENIYLHSLREALLPKLMSGEIDVSNIQL